MSWGHRRPRDGTLKGGVPICEAPHSGYSLTCCIAAPLVSAHLLIATQHHAAPQHPQCALTNLHAALQHPQCALTYMLQRGRLVSVRSLHAGKQANWHASCLSKKHASQMGGNICRPLICPWWGYPQAGKGAVRANRGGRHRAYAHARKLSGDSVVHAAPRNMPPIKNPP